MFKFKSISYDEFAKKLRRAEYVPIRKSKHVIYFNSEKQITIPFPHKHRGDVPAGLLHKLIKEMGISIDGFNCL